MWDSLHAPPTEYGRKSRDLTCFWNKLWLPWGSLGTTYSSMFSGSGCVCAEWLFYFSPPPAVDSVFPNLLKQLPLVHLFPRFPDCAAVLLSCSCEFMPLKKKNLTVMGGREGKISALICCLYLEVGFNSFFKESVEWRALRTLETSRPFPFVLYFFTSGICPKKSSEIWTKVFILMLTALLLIYKAKHGKQTKCPTREKCFRNQWSIHMTK